MKTNIRPTLSLLTNRLALLLALVLAPIAHALAQKPFTEGSIHYKVMFEAADKKAYDGTYVFTVKGGQIRKELKLGNGFEDIVLINTNNGTIYSLRAKNGKKFAIQLSMEEMQERQRKYIGYTMKPQTSSDKVIAGMAAHKGELLYKNGTTSEIYYSNDWYPEKTITYERFPDARFLPLSYVYKDEVKGFIMRMDAESVKPGPVENSIFRIPEDYKIISNEEYKQLSQK